MRLAVSQGVGKAVDTDDPAALRSWVNKEARDLHGQSRKAINALNPEAISPAVTTDGAGTFAILWTSEVMPQDAIWEIRAHVSGNSATVRASYSMVGVFQSVAGTCTQVFPTAYDHGYESAVACDARFSMDATNRWVTVDARDDAVVAMTWTGSVYTPAEVVVE